jgi:hypothetical protein
MREVMNQQTKTPFAQPHSLKAKSHACGQTTWFRQLSSFGGGWFNSIVIIAETVS